MGAGVMPLDSDRFSQRLRPRENYSIDDPQTAHHLPQSLNCSTLKFMSLQKIDDQAILANNSQLIAALAWQGYQQEGRGVVFIDTTSKTSSQPPSSYCRQISFIYFGEKAFLTQEDLKTWLDTSIGDQLQEYDPTEEVLCLICNQLKIRFMRFQPQSVPPPQAYQKLKNRLSEFRVF
ncbi:MAG: hypothetical protein F6K58_21525 [Symploca sp. SIO2E9]|nr:hypothetical protein [Symploca sp. SIO2E9]